MVDTKAENQTANEDDSLDFLRQNPPTSPVAKGRKVVSVYAIARNEAKFAKRWYDCVKEADEVCVLVNNSTDNTAQILRDLGAKVAVKNYSEWRFDRARNDSMRLVSPIADILFCLDMDETVQPGWRKILEDTWITAEQKGIQFDWCRYTEVLSFKEDGSPKEVFPQYKIHRPMPNIWTHKIHETPLVNENRVIPLAITLEHHPDPTKDRSYYITLMEQEFKESPNNPRAAFYLGREYLCTSRYSEAIPVLSHYLKLPLSNPIESAFAFYYLALAYGYLGDHDKEMQYLWQANLFAPQCREFLWVLIIRASERKSHWEVVKLCQMMLDKNQHQAKELVYTESKDASGAKFYMLYSEALWYTANFKAALAMADKSVAIEPNNQEAINFRASIYHTYEETKGNPILNPQQPIKTEDKK